MQRQQIMLARMYMPYRIGSTYCIYSRKEDQRAAVSHLMLEVPGKFLGLERACHRCAPLTLANKPLNILQARRARSTESSPGKKKACAQRAGQALPALLHELDELTSPFDCLNFRIE
eukprot:scaffold552_cov19-Tisochrysis_lutea.AAC.1